MMTRDFIINKCFKCDYMRVTSEFPEKGREIVFHGCQHEQCKGKCVWDIKKCPKEGEQDD